MKNELSSIYEQMLLTEAEKSKLENPSNDTVGSLKPKQELFGTKPKAVEGPDKAKVHEGPKREVSVGSSSKPDTKSSFKGSAPAKDTKAEAPKEVKEDEAEPKSDEDEKEDDKKQKNESIEEPMSAFEALFKKTVTEELEDEMVADDSVVSEEPMAIEDESEAEESEEEGEEEEDLISDLKDLQDKLASILSKLEDSVEDSEEESMEGEEDYSEEDFDNEFQSEELEDETVKEAVEKPKALSDAHGKKLISKKNKIGKVNPKGGKAHIGSVDDEPKPKVLGDKKKALQKVHGKPEPKSTVKKGDFFK